MKAIKIQSQKDFMTKILTTDIFDFFLVNEITIETYNTFNINGRINNEFYNDVDSDDNTKLTDKANQYSTWSVLRPVCFNLIKGKRTPLGFKFVFYLDDENKAKLISENEISILPEQVVLGLNIKYANGEMILTSGTAFNIFTLDKELEKAWDSYIPSFLDKNNIEYEIMT